LIFSDRDSNACMGFVRVVCVYAVCVCECDAVCVCECVFVIVCVCACSLLYVLCPTLYHVLLSIIIIFCRLIGRGHHDNTAKVSSLLKHETYSY